MCARQAGGIFYNQQFPFARSADPR
jgi:hypothetical protein